MAKKFRSSHACVALALAAVSVWAFASPTLSIGTADVDDFKLNNSAASAISYDPGVNPAQGGGNSSGFARDFSSAAFGTGSWSLVSAVSSDDHNAGTFTGGLPGLPGKLVFSFTQTSDTYGSWSVTNADMKDAVRLDLVAAMHAGDASTAFLFNNLQLDAGAKLVGSWDIEWQQGNGHAPQTSPGFSNVEFFGREGAVVPPVTPAGKVPEPTSIALFGLGLLGMGFLGRRKAR